MNPTFRNFAEALTERATQDQGEPAPGEPAERRRRRARAPLAGAGPANRLRVPRAGGGPLRINGFRHRAWLPATTAAGLPGLRIHKLRHTAVALWIAAGAFPKEVAARAGHTSVSFVLDRYGHLFPESDAALRDRLDLLFRDAMEQRRNTAG
jgi:integrase